MFNSVLSNIANNAGVWQNNPIVYAAIGVYCVFLIIAAVGDVKSFTITNKLNILFFLSFLIFAPFLGLGFAEIGQHFLVALAAFLICFVLFTIGVFGGGDVKLVGATAFWLGSAPMMSYVFYTAIAGGFLAIIILTSRLLAKKYGLPRSPKWLRQMLRGHSAIPYGVALCIGGMVALSQASWL